MDGKRTAYALLFCIDSSFPTDVTRRLQVAAADDENIRSIEEIGARMEIPGISNYLSALKENRRLAKIFAPAVVSCTTGRRIQNEAGTRTKLATSEDLISLLPHRFCAQPPTLKIMELCIERQNFRTQSRWGLPTAVFLPHHVLDRCEEPDILEHVQFRLRLPDAPSTNGATDTNDDINSVEATPSRIVITLFRVESTSRTVLVVTTLRYTAYSTLFIFHHFLSRQKEEAPATKLTSFSKRILRNPELASGLSWQASQIL